MIVQAADDDCIDLDWPQPQFARQINAGQHGTQTVASGDFLEIGRIEGIEAEADAVEPGLAQRVPLLGKEKSVGRHSQVGYARDEAKPGDQRFQALSQQRLAAGQANFVDAELDGKPYQALDFLEGEKVRTRLPLAGDGRGWRGIFQGVELDAVKVGGLLRFRQAVKAAKVAAVGDTDPQVAHDAAMRVGKEI